MPKTKVRKVGSVEERLRSLHRMSLEMVASDSVDELLQQTADDACRLVDADLGVLAEVDRETGELARIYDYGVIRDVIPDGTVIQGAGLLGRILSGETLRTSDATSEMGFVGYPEWHPRVGPLVGVPVAHEGRLLAILLVGRADTDIDFDDADAELVETLARMAAVVLRDRLRSEDLRRLNERLAEMAATDQLTGIGNRRSFDEAIARAHAEALRHGIEYGLLLLDVDRFKAFNDAHGHPAGDGALAQVAAALADTIRVEDQVFRYGGEEFAVIARVHDSRGLASLGERLREAVEAMAIPHGQQGFDVLTCSLGGAVFSRRSAAVQLPTWENVLERADTALYRAKNQGRNRVVIWKP